MCYMVSALITNTFNVLTVNERAQVLNTLEEGVDMYDCEHIASSSVEYKLVTWHHVQ